MLMSFLIFGIIIFLISAFDIIYTILSSNGAGFLSKYCMRFIASIFKFIANGFNSRFILKYAGVFILWSMIIIWVLLLWISVFLIFLHDPNSVLNSTNLNPADTIEKFYFSGYILSTLGNGEFKPQTGAWQIVANFFSFSGFVFLTTVQYLRQIRRIRLLVLADEYCLTD